MVRLALNRQRSDWESTKVSKRVPTNFVKTPYLEPSYLPRMFEGEIYFHPSCTILPLTFLKFILDYSFIDFFSLCLFPEHIMFEKYSEPWSFK